MKYKEYPTPSHHYQANTMSNQMLDDKTEKGKLTHKQEDTM